MVPGVKWDVLLRICSKKGYKMKVSSTNKKNASKKGSVLDIGKRQVLNRTVNMNELGRTIFNKKEEDGVVARMDTNAALCDFAGPGRTVFQVTVSDQHTISKQGLEELLISSGRVHRVGNTIEKSEGTEHIGMINLYWLFHPVGWNIGKQGT